MNSRTLALFLGALTIGGFGSLMGLRDSFSWVTGDEGTYMAMAESLARDGDLLFASADRARLEAAASEGERVLILQRTGRGITYSKPLLYPLLASPFSRLLGRYGPIALNALALAGALWLTLLYLRRLPGHDRRLTLVTFIGASALLPYFAWRMSDALLVSFTLAGLVLGLAAVRKSADPLLDFTPFFDGKLAPLLGGALLGFAAMMRYPNALLAVAACGALLWSGHRRRAAYLLLGAALAALLTVWLTIQLTGAPDPYRTARATFSPEVGYPDGADSSVARRQLGGTELATVRLRTEPRPRVVAYSSLYFLAGRHTGVLLYFPAALVFALLALRRPDRVAVALLAAVAGIALFYLLFLPHNYFGGGAAIGNRYFLAAYPALLVAQRELPRPRWLIVPWLIALLALGSAIVSVRRTRLAERTSQSHAHAGLFRLLPFESTLQSIEGSKERFWLHEWGWEMLRFNDPFQRLGQFSFLLESGQPATEIEIANTRADGRLRFLVASDAPRLFFDYQDWRRRETVELERPFGERGVVEIAAAPAWRRHQMWFHWRLEDVFYARLLRLAIRTPDGSAAAAEVRYLGRAQIPRDIYSREVLGSELPTLAGAGTTSTATVTVRNTSSGGWSSRTVLGVFLSYKLFHRTATGVEVIEGARTPLPDSVAPGEVLEAEIEIAWPPATRNYGLAIDLVHEGIAWFEEHNGSPLARSEVRVVSLPKAEPQPDGAP